MTDLIKKVMKEELDAVYQRHAALVDENKRLKRRLKAALQYHKP